MTNARCPACGWEASVLGTLGSLRHYRCRDCGAEFSRTIRRRARKPTPPLPRAKVRWTKRGGRLYGVYGKLRAVVWDLHGSVDRPMAYLFQYKIVGRNGVTWVQGNASRIVDAMRRVEEGMKTVLKNGARRNSEAVVVAKDPTGATHTLTHFKGSGSSFGAKMHVRQIRQRAAHGGDFFTGWKAGYAMLRNGACRKKVCKNPHHRRSLRNRAIDTAWTGKKADFVSKRGDYGAAPYSELSMHTGAAGARIVRFALFSDANRWPWVTWAHIETSSGQVLDGTPGEVLPDVVRRKLGGFGNEKMPMAARLKK